MNSDAKLQKLDLGPDWIDLSFGEPKIVMDALFRQINRFGDPFKMPKIQDILNWTYQPAAGTKDLVRLLENKYDAKVVICNGAKQALAASLYAFKRSGCSKLYYGKPYYPANPSISQTVGIDTSDTELQCDCKLLTSPNNPDGRHTNSQTIIKSQCEMPTIHDAAYHTEIYLPENEIPLPLGNIQVFSMSKMYGLSGLRIGYAVCHSEQYYKDVVTYIETATAGVSSPSQDIALKVESFFQNTPGAYEEFTAECRSSLKHNRELLKDIDPEVLTVEPCETNSMFAWCKVGPKFDNVTAKVHMLRGSIFGASNDYVRINIAYPEEIMREAITRLNESKIRS